MSKDPNRIDEDRDAAMSFYGLQPLLFDGTRWMMSLATWLYDRGLILRICHGCLIIEDDVRKTSDACKVRGRFLSPMSLGHEPSSGKDDHMPYRESRDLSGQVLRPILRPRIGLARILA